MGGVQAVSLDGPRCTRVLADAESHSGRGDNQMRQRRMGAYLMDIGIDVDGGGPGGAVIQGTRYAAHMNVGEQCATVAGGTERSHPQRRPDDFVVDDGGSGVPGLTPGNILERRHSRERGVRSQPQNARLKLLKDCTANS